MVPVTQILMMRLTESVVMETVEDMTAAYMAVMGAAK
jgi:hypothetical protein